MIVAGIDEAGYGPRLGPLTVACTAFRVEPRATARAPRPVSRARAEDPPCLWKELEHAVRRGPTGDAARVWVADSKEIKPRKDGMEQLEVGVLSFLAALGPAPTTLAGLVTALGDAPHPFSGIPWYGDVSQSRVPAFVWPGQVATRAKLLAEAAERSGVSFAGAAARVVDEVRFNAHVEAAQNKAAVVADACVDLLRALRAGYEGPIDVTLDKQGGRSVYAPLLGKAFPMCPIDIEHEEHAWSRYRVKTARGPIRATFRMEAELHSLPVALASMTCKYLRERFMERLNAWFRERVPGLEPTAGYATDANRFLADVETSLPRLGLTLASLVRTR